MDLNRDIKNIGLFEKVCEVSSEQALDAEMNLPDYCPEIQRIVKCNVIPNVVSVRHQPGRITAEVNAVIRLIYVGESGNISSFEQTSSFEKTIEHSAVSQDCSVGIKVTADYVNCRALNPRKADIRSMLKFICSVSKKRDETVLCGVTGAGIQTMSDDYEFASVSSVNERIFTVSEIKEIPEEKPTVVSVISGSASAVCSEVKVINNKALLKGECTVKIYYISDENGNVECTEHSMPISQIIEADGLDEGDTVSTAFEIYSCEVFSKVNAGGEMRQLDINVGISCFLISFTSKPVSLISDAYSTEYELNQSTKSIEISSVNTEFENVFTNKTVLESIGVSVDKILCARCGELSYSFSLKENKCHISGTYDITVIYVDSEKQIGIIKKPLNFDYAIQLNGAAENIKCFGNVMILGCACVATGESRLEIKTEMKASGIVLESRIRKYVSAVEIGDENIKKENKSSLTIYFADKGETVWNIARKYCTTVEAILKENDLTENILSAGKMLLIPGVEEI